MIVHLQVIASPEIDGDESSHCNVSLKNRETERRMRKLSFPFRFLSDVAVVSCVGGRERKKSEIAIIRGKIAFIYIFIVVVVIFTHVRTENKPSPKHIHGDILS